mgnify:CR=1 FL=1
MKPLLAMLICILSSASAEELLVIPKGTYMDERFDSPTVNNRIRPPKNMNWQVIGTEYVGTPKEQSSAKAQSLMAFWTQNPHNGLLLEFSFKFDQKPEFFEFHLGRNYTKIYFKNGSLRFRRDENIDGKIKSIDHEIAKQLATNRWNKIRIESINNQYLIKVNKSTPIFTKSIGDKPEIFGGFKITGLGVNKLYLDNIVLKSVKGPSSNLNEKINSYTHLGSASSNKPASAIAKSTPPKSQTPVQKKIEQAPNASAPKAKKVVKTDKLIYI